MDSYLIEYAGICAGASYDFQMFEEELQRSEKDAAKLVNSKLDGTFIQKIRVTKFNVSEGTSRDVTEDIMQWCAELYEFEFDRDGNGIYATNCPALLEQAGWEAAQERAA